MKVMQRKKKREKGQSLVEFAVSVVILLLLLSGIVDLGRLLFQYISMRDAAQEGATYGIIEPTDCNGIVTRTAGLLSDPTNINVGVTINGTTCASADASDACGGNEIIVTVTNPTFHITMPFLGTILGGQNIPVTTRISGTILRPSCP
jgi:Flp pilus assembly protein TadG